MSRRKEFYIILFIIFAFSVIFYFYAMSKISKPIDYDELSIVTSKQEYNAEEKAVVIIENTSDKKACFSSCYPFYVQIQNPEKKFYNYEECPYEDVANICIDPYQKKSFEIDLKGQAMIVPADYRLVVSACLSCNLGDAFKREEFFFSNEFRVK